MLPGIRSKLLLKSLLARLWGSPTVGTWAAFGVRTFQVVLVLPLALRHFTDSETALWSVFSALLVFQPLADFGFQATFVRLTAYAFGGANRLEASLSECKSLPSGQPNWALIGRITSATRWLYGQLGWVLCGLCLVVGSGLLWRRIEALGQTPAHLLAKAAAALEAGDSPLASRLTQQSEHMTTPAQAWLAWGVIVSVTVTSFRLNSALVYLSGCGQLALVRRWETFFGFGSLFSCAGVLWWRGSLLGLVLTNQTWLLLSVARNQWLVRRVHGGKYREFPSPNRDREILRIAWPNAWRAGVGSWAGQGAVQFGGLIYAQQRDSAAVASYLICLRLVQTIGVVAGGAISSRLPHLAVLWTRGDRVAFAAQARRGVSLSLWATALPLAVLAWVGPWFLKSGLHSSVPFVGRGTWTLLALAAFCERYGSGHLALETAGNRVRWHTASVVYAMLFGAVATVGFPSLGVNALPLGMLTASAGFLCWYGRMGTRTNLGLHWLGFDLETALAPTLLVGGAVSLRWLIG